VTKAIARISRISDETEANLVDAVHDLGRGRRQFRPFEWIDMNDYDVAAVAAVNERKDRGIAHVPTVPVMLASNFDRLKHQRQTGRREHCVGSDRIVLEDLDLAGANIGGR
jgi:hypothetical protein